jgi:hypothetical protein
MVTRPNLDHLMLLQVLPGLPFRRFLFRRGKVVTSQRYAVHVDGEGDKPRHGTELFLTKSTGGYSAPTMISPIKMAAPITRIITSPVRRCFVDSVMAKPSTGPDCLTTRDRTPHRSVKRKKSIATRAATRTARVAPLHRARPAGFRGSFQRRGSGCWLGRLSRAASSRSPIGCYARWSSNCLGSVVKCDSGQKSLVMRADPAALLASRSARSIVCRIGGW